jgi:hypothetical protein
MTVAFLVVTITSIELRELAPLLWRGIALRISFHGRHNLEINKTREKMKNKILKIFSIAAFLSVHSAFAVTPESGWWWNPNEPGRGFNIEAQKRTLFIATYVYDQKGNPLWYTGSGELDENSTLTTELLLSEGGPCIGCPYQAPTTTEAGIPITLAFTSRGEGTVLWEGETVPIERFNFKIGEGPEKLLGKWVLITTEPGKITHYIGEKPNGEEPEPNGTGDYYGDWVVFKEITMDGVASGSRLYKVNDKVEGGRTESFPGFTYSFSMELPEKQHVFELLNIVYRVGTIRGFAFNFNGLNKIEGLVSEVPASAISLSSLWDEVTHRGTPFVGYRIK